MGRKAIGIISAIVAPLHVGFLVFSMFISLFAEGYPEIIGWIGLIFYMLLGVVTVMIYRDIKQQNSMNNSAANKNVHRSALNWVIATLVLGLFVGPVTGIFYYHVTKPLGGTNRNVPLDKTSIRLIVIVMLLAVAVPISYLMSTGKHRVFNPIVFVITAVAYIGLNLYAIKRMRARGDYRLKIFLIGALALLLLLWLGYGL